MWWLLFSCSAPVGTTEPPRVDEPAKKASPEPRRRRPEAAAHPDEGKWQLARPIEEQLEALEAIGYVQGSEEGSGRKGVTLSTDGVAPGLNLWTSGHLPQAHLMASDGTILHTWQLTFEAAFDETPERGTDHMFWRRVKLLPDGDLLAIYEGRGIVRLDRDSNVRWKRRTRTHHDIHLNDDGTFWVLHREHRKRTQGEREVAWTEDQVMVMTLDGEEQRRFSVVEAFEGTPWEREVAARSRRGDFLHTNTLTWLDGAAADRLPAFAKGNLLLSSRKRNLIFVIDPRTEKVVWSHRGRFRRQHDPTVVDGGAGILLFDNDGGGRGQSVVRQLSIPTMQETWSYQGSEDDPFYSQLCGAAQRLPNGNTLITETNYGRAFEVDRKGTKVWEYYTPYRAGDEQQFVAWIPELERLDPAREPAIRAWLTEASN